jgi:hypothetical protein
MSKTYLVSLESSDATSTFGSIVWVATPWCDKLPHLDGLVQTSGHEILSIWSECNRVDRVLVSIWTFKTLNKITRDSIPDSHALIEGSGGNELGIRRDGNGSDTIFNAESENVLPSLDIPETDCAITTSGSNGTTITSEVQ